MLSTGWLVEMAVLMMLLVVMPTRSQSTSSDEGPEGALTALFGSAAAYGTESGGPRAHYSEASVSWPPEDSQPVDIVQHLPHADRSLLCSHFIAEGQ